MMKSILAKLVPRQGGPITANDSIDRHQSDFA